MFTFYNFQIHIISFTDSLWCEIERQYCIFETLQKQTQQGRYYVTTEFKYILLVDLAIMYIFLFSPAATVVNTVTHVAYAYPELEMRVQPTGEQNHYEPVAKYY